jgi:dUTP pyrophosphatase
MARFEVVSKYADADMDIQRPVRKTKEAAGYDFTVAEDTVILPYKNLYDTLRLADRLPIYEEKNKTIDEVAALTKKYNAKPTLVPTGVKCKLEPDTYLELSVRSSSPLKYWLILANGVGIIDGDYYNNKDNEGEIFFQLINLSPYPILLKKGDAIGQGIIKPYLKTEDDVEGGLRTGGFGSTSYADQDVLQPAT